MYIITAGATSEGTVYILMVVLPRVFTSSHTEQRS